MRISKGWLVLAVVAFLSSWVQAQDPLRLVPGQADFVVKIAQPRQVAESLYEHEVLRDWLKIDGVKELFDTTNFRRLLQLHSYYEKELGVGGIELLDRLTGGGAVLATRFENPVALLVVQAKDEALLKKFVKLAAAFVEQELARQESKDRLEPSKFAGIDGYRIGKACVALQGSTLLAASDRGTLEAVLSLSKKKGTSVLESPAFKGAAVPKDALVWTWVNMESARKVQNFKAGLDALGMDPNGLVLFGGLVDLLQRTPHFVAGISGDKKAFALEVSTPRGREGMNAKAALYLPSDDRGSLPLLYPPRTLVSLSYYFDLKGFWDNRDKLLNKKQLKDIDDFNNNSGRFLGGTKLGTLFQQVGPHQRVVVAQPAQSSYKIKPEQKIVAFALVQEMRDPAFGKSMNTVLRAGGILASLTYNVKLVEEQRDGHNIVAYYFPEDKKVPGDVKNARFNFSPSFVTVGDQIVFASTVELARDLVDALSSTKSGSSPATTQISLSSRGGAQALRDNHEQLLAQAILNQALPPAEARKQIDSFIDLVERLGNVRFEIRYGQNDFNYSVRWQYGVEK